MASASQRHFDRAGELLAAGQLAEAEAILRKLQQHEPRNPGVLLLLAEVLTQRGNTAGAVSAAERAVCLLPHDIPVLVNAATIFRRAHDRTRTIELLTRACGIIEAAPEQFPAGPGAWNLLVEALLWCERPADALEVARRGHHCHPDHQGPLIDEAQAMIRMDQVGPAIALLRSVIARWPDALGAHQTLAFCTNYDATTSLRQSLLDHLNFGRTLQQAVAADVAARAGPRFTAPTAADADRPLRVGILSHDLRSHSVAYFIEPVLSAIRTADPAGRNLTLIGLPTATEEDAVTARIKASCHEWHPLGHMVDARAAERISELKIDVLIELNGLTGGERLVLLLLKPAPLILTYLGYPNITGMPTVDARLTDRFTDPPEADVALASAATAVGVATPERLVRLDGPFLCYRPPDNVPEIAPPPFERNGFVTFGSFNAIRKLSTECLQLWSRTLAAVPGSRLLIKNQGLAVPAARENLLQRLEHAGITRDRVICLDYAGSTAEHLRCYNQVDIALDSFPYCGTTTTFESVLMGVPVITRAGETHASRVGLAIMNYLGTPGFAADTDDAFIAAAAALAAKPAELRRLRATLRIWLLASPLCNPAGMGHRFASAVHALWRQRSTQ